MIAQSLAMISMRNFGSPHANCHPVMSGKFSRAPTGFRNGTTIIVGDVVIIGLQNCESGHEGGLGGVCIPCCCRVRSFRGMGVGTTVSLLMFVSM